MRAAAIRVAIIGLMSALVGACTIPVTTDYNARIGVDHCHVFTWQNSVAAHDAGAFDNPLNLQRLHGAIADALAARGVTLASVPEQAQCVVGAAIGVRTAADEAFVPPYIEGGFGYGRGHRHGLFDAGIDDDYVYNEGSVSIDLYDAITHEPIWHAAAHRDVTKLTGEKAEAGIRQAVQALFAHYPRAISG